MRNKKINKLGPTTLFPIVFIVVASLLKGMDIETTFANQSTVVSSPTTLSSWVYLPMMTLGRYIPPATNSYYIWTVTDTWGLGCDVGTRLGNLSGYQDGFVFLNFGNPNQDSQARLGTVLYNQTPIILGEIATAVEVFANGFYYCSQLLGAADTITIAVGTNSSGGTVTDLIAARHGEAWANLVIGINEDFLAYPGLTSRVVAVGGINIEPNFNPVYVPQHWMDGYHSVTDSRRQIVYVIGSADECPLNYPPSIPNTYTPQDCLKKYDGTTLLYKWTQEDVRYISWGLPLAWPFPEIYNSATAQQWYRISLLSRFNNSISLHFRGEITQLGACTQLREQNPGMPFCEGTDYPPSTGFLALYNLIQNDQYTSLGNFLKWSTDIKNYYGP